MSLPAVPRSRLLPEGKPPSADETPIPAFTMLGTKVHALSIHDLHRVIDRAVSNRSQAVIVSQNLHGLHVYHRDAAMRELHGDSYVRVDGMPLVFWGQLLGYPLKREHRVTWVDWMPQLMSEAVRRRWRVFYVGASEGVASRGAQVLRARYPGLTIETHHGHFDHAPHSPDNRAVLELINAWQPDVLMVGMGMPRQERWTLANRELLRTPVILTCGAAIEYFAGSMVPPPRWMGQVGLEWLHRLLNDPRRLAARYLVEPWSLSRHAWRDLKSRVWLPRRGNRGSN